MNFKSHPPILWLQADNCFKENKNRWMMAFCYWLIYIGWFQEIMISMLSFSHTYIDFDQMFSTLAQYLDQHSIEFITDIIDCVDQVYKKEDIRAKGHFLPFVFKRMVILNSSGLVRSKDSAFVSQLIFLHVIRTNVVLAAVYNKRYV